MNKQTTMTTIQSLIDLNGKKFDVCLMNPPYGSSGGNNINLRFVEKCINTADKQVVIMPNNIIKRNRGFKDFYQKTNGYWKSVEEIDSKVFKDTNMENVAIYVFERNSDLIKIKYIDGTVEEIDNILNKNFDNFSEYESNLIKYLFNDKEMNYYEIKYRGYNKKDSYTKSKEEYVKYRLNNLSDNYIYLRTSVNYDKKLNWISNTMGQIGNKEEISKYIIDNTLAACNLMKFKSEKAAENCKIALKNPLLKFVLYKTVTPRHITIDSYKYVPDIDWSNPKTKTDEGLLELCGCPKDKCKEYAEYCKKIIEEVDKK